MLRSAQLAAIGVWSVPVPCRRWWLKVHSMTVARLVLPRRIERVARNTCVIRSRVAVAHLAGFLHEFAPGCTCNIEKYFEVCECLVRDWS